MTEDLVARWRAEALAYIEQEARRFLADDCGLAGARLDDGTAELVRKAALHLDGMGAAALSRITGLPLQ